MSTSLSTHNGCVSMFRKYGGCVATFGVHGANEVTNNNRKRNKNSVQYGTKSKNTRTKGRSHTTPSSLTFFAMEMREPAISFAPSTSTTAKPRTSSNPRMKLLSLEYRLDDLCDVARDHSLTLFQRANSTVCTKIQAMPSRVCDEREPSSSSKHSSLVDYGSPEYLLLTDRAHESDWIDLGANDDDDSSDYEMEDGWEHVAIAYSYDGIYVPPTLEPLSYAQAAQTAQDWPCTEPMRRSVFHKETPKTTSITTLAPLLAVVASDGPEAYSQLDWEGAKIRGARRHQLHTSHKKKRRERQLDAKKA
jgi:hypothetical protein